MNLLVVEDEPRMVELLRKGFEEEGHTVSCALNGEEGWVLASNGSFDLIVLDVMMPKLDGFTVAGKLRKGKISTPVIMLTAKDSVPDIVRGLDLGADDYVTKPFSFQELVARVHAVRRRASSGKGSRMQVADLVVDTSTREVWREQKHLFLSRTEYGLLEAMIDRAGEVVSRRFLTDSVWGGDREVEDNTLDAFIRLLRHKIDGEGQRRLIHTVRGSGYVISEEAPR
jgi:two-component system response regulator MprA